MRSKKWRGGLQVMRSGVSPRPLRVRVFEGVPATSGDHQAVEAVNSPAARDNLKENYRNMTNRLDWSQCPAVESIPGKVSGAWLFRDTRMPVSIVFENLEAGATIDEIMEWFDVTREQVVAVLQFAARSLDAPPAIHQPARTVDAHTL